MTFHLLHLKNIPIFQQLQIEEALLRSDSGNWFILNEGSPPAIVMGISGKPHELIDQTKMDAAPLPLIKRFSGGGTVVVDENTLFATFICQKELHGFPPYPEQIHKWAEEFYKAALPLEQFALKENDYTLGEKKCGGNAQYIRKDRWLHHSSFLWDYKKERMEYLLMPKKQPAYRKKRPHKEFLCTLSNNFSKKETLFNACKQELKKRYAVKEVSYAKVLKMTSDSKHRKATVLL